MLRVGDKVRVISLEEYNRRKDGEGKIRDPYGSELIFSPQMMEYCGKEVTIDHAFLDFNYPEEFEIYRYEIVEKMGRSFYFADWMFDIPIPKLIFPYKPKPKILKDRE